MLGANFFSQQADANQHQRDQGMSDLSLAAIARELAKAMITRAKTRHPDDQKVVLALQTQLVAEYLNEKENEETSLVLN